MAVLQNRTRPWVAGWGCTLCARTLSEGLNVDTNRFVSAFKLIHMLPQSRYMVRLEQLTNGKVMESAVTVDFLAYREVSNLNTFF
jgi:hypothetical protein